MKNPLKVAAKLATLLTPETNQQPRIDGQGWFIYWHPHPARGERLCVGVAFAAHGNVYRHLLDDDQAAQAGQLYGPAALANLSTLLDAAAGCLDHGDLTPPSTFEYEPVKPVRGDTPGEILAMLWANGPGVLARAGKKKDATTAPLINEPPAPQPEKLHTPAAQDGRDDDRADRSASGTVQQRRQKT